MRGGSGERRLLVLRLPSVWCVRWLCAARQPELGSRRRARADGKPSSRWVSTVRMLEVLRGVLDVVRSSPDSPTPNVHLFSEAKGWFSNDTEALRAVVPHALT